LPVGAFQRIRLSLRAFQGIGRIATLKTENYDLKPYPGSMLQELQNGKYFLTIKKVFNIRIVIKTVAAIAAISFPTLAGPEGSWRYRRSYGIPREISWVPEKSDLMYKNRNR